MEYKKNITLCEQKKSCENSRALSPSPKKLVYATHIVRTHSQMVIVKANRIKVWLQIMNVKNAHTIRTDGVEAVAVASSSSSSPSPPTEVKSNSKKDVLICYLWSWITAEKRARAGERVRPWTEGKEWESTFANGQEVSRRKKNEICVTIAFDN